MQVRSDFAEVIEYFRKESRNFHVIFAGSFGLSDGRRIGLDDLIRTVLSI
jgi:hypothetical protein